MDACRPEKLRHLITPTTTRTSYSSIQSEMQRERYKMEREAYWIGKLAAAFTMYMQKKKTQERTGGLLDLQKH